MSTLNTASFGSDDEDDKDFVLSTTISARKAGTKKRRRGSNDESGSSDSGSDDDSDIDVDDEVKIEAKRLKQEAEEVEAKKRKEETERLFKSMMEDEPVGPIKEKVELVEIKRPRQFAGETVYETVSLPKDHPDVVAYFARQKDSENTTTGSTSQTPSTSSLNLQSTEVPSATTTTNDTNTSTLPTSNPSTVSAPKPKGKGPMRRKPRQSLEAMSAALDKGKKMTTLEKSQMDWKSHTSADPSVQAELEANRRSGGYLDKQEFLDRVGERRTGALDAQGRR